jgi:hypothetical protein
VAMHPPVLAARTICAARKPAIYCIRFGPHVSRIAWLEAAGGAPRLDQLRGADPESATVPFGFAARTARSVQAASTCSNLSFRRVAKPAGPSATNVLPIS